MSGAAPTRRDLLQRPGTLSVVRAGPTGAVAPPPDATGADAELFVALCDDGSVHAFNGHVDLGTGIRTALAQIVADELDVPFARVTMILGHTEDAPNQGPTIASETIQITAVPLRQAAATARQALVRRAGAVLGADPAELTVEDGVVYCRPRNRSVSYAELLAGRSDRLAIDGDAPVKAVSAYRIVGRSTPRVDIPAKASGQFVYVHDVSVPGMLHGRVVRPPYAGLDAGDFVGNSLVSVDETSLGHLAGIVAVVVIRDFVGVVAEREEQAIAAARDLAVVWREPPDLPVLDRPETALRVQASTPRRLLDRGDVDGALAAVATSLDRSYVWPYQMHASIGPSCSVAAYDEDGLTVWSGTQNPHLLRADLALLLGLAEERVEVIRHEAAGCYGRNCADDVGADAALLSRAVGRPVRVQLSREQEHAWEPKGAAQVVDVRGGLDEEGAVLAYDFSTRYPSNLAPTLALLLTRAVEPVPAVLAMGDRTAIPPYDYANARVTVHDMAPIVRASWFRGVSALPNSFAHESWIDECAFEAGVDPLEYRLRYLPDRRAAELSRAVADRAGWSPRTTPGTLGGQGEILRGRGFAQALYVHGPFPGKPAAWSAWVADVEVNRATGEVAVTRVTVGQDAGLVINPAGARHQIHGNVIQSTSRALMEEVGFEGGAVATREWGSYPILTFSELPAIEVLQMRRPTEPPLGSGESASIPSAAAIANAIFDATGVRFRELPFTPERIRQGLAEAGLALAPGLPSPGPPAPSARTPPRARSRRSLAALVATGIAGAVGMATAVLPWRPALSPIPRPDASVYAPATIARGRQLAGLGGCLNCHTGDGPTLAGGHALETPFGRIYSTNITPDPVHGIGAWSYPAFERAMREGIGRDGRHLYPAHPYTSFTHTSDADLQALYAFLMAQPASDHVPPETRLAFPFGLRPLLAPWNALFLRTRPLVDDPARSAAWNRGRYLVEGLGHCGACHTPRNVVGAERGGGAHLSGAILGGWEAPALSSLSRAPVPWTETAYYDYLRTGFSQFHGVAAGPMAAVVAELAVLPDADVGAMATYLASLGHDAGSQTGEAERRAHLESQAKVDLPGMPGAKIYHGACAACHEMGTGPTLFGVKPSLALNTGVYAATPDNLLQVILHGIMQPARSDLGYMPGFGGSLNDRQIADLAAYIRQRFAGSQPAWSNLPASLARLRARPMRGGAR